MELKLREDMEPAIESRMKRSGAVYFTKDRLGVVGGFFPALGAQRKL
jgi:hypothetical protein